MVIFLLWTVLESVGLCHYSTGAGTHGQCCQKYIPSFRTWQSFGRYQVVLHADRGHIVCVTETTGGQTCGPSVTNPTAPSNSVMRSVNESYHLIFQQHLTTVMHSRLYLYDLALQHLFISIIIIMGLRPCHFMHFLGQSILCMKCVTYARDIFLLR